jgi:hypothetical protein
LLRSLPLRVKGAKKWIGWKTKYPTKTPVTLQGGPDCWPLKSRSFFDGLSNAKNFEMKRG